MDKPHRIIEAVILAAIAAGYLLVGGLYATQTAPWQAPDEPAHYNYIAQLAEGGCCPVIAMGDWDNDYLETLKANKFASTLTADLPSIQYEDHQPPLYYLLASVIYTLTGGSLLAIRGFSVLLGLGVIVSGYGVARVMFPARRGVALATAALLAFIPQHVATIASVNNDALAYLLAAVTLLVCARYLTIPNPLTLPRPIAYTAAGVAGLLALLLLTTLRGPDPVTLLLVSLLAGLAASMLPRFLIADVIRWHLLLGGLVGLAFVTKTTVYFLAAVVVLAIVLRPAVIVARGTTGKTVGIALNVAGVIGKNLPQNGSHNTKKLGRRLGWGLLRQVPKVYGKDLRATRQTILRGGGIALGVAVAFGAVWWGRNMLVYGPTDFLGLHAHDVVVVGQLRTAERIAQVGGMGAYFSAAAATTFNSFWGQLGWMALPITPAYPAIRVLLLTAFAGLVLEIALRYRSGERPPTAIQVSIGLLLGLTGLLAVAAFVYYNFSFYQVQGRYLFPALIPFALLVAVGVDAWMRWLSHTIRRLRPAAATYVGYLSPLMLAAGFGALNLWLIRFVVPTLAP